MKIVADTHFYYYFGKDAKLFEKVAKEPISPTLYNVLELCTTRNLVKIEDDVREAHRKMIHYNDHIIFEPPFTYIAKQFCDIQFDVEKEFGEVFKFSEAIAKGDKIDPGKIEFFNTWAKDMRSNSFSIADIVNDKLESIRPNIKDKKEHRKKDSIPITMHLINHLVQTATRGSCDLMERDLSSIELFIKTMDHFFKGLEVSKRKMKPNDVVDLLMLAYVQPGDKFWTNENLWIQMITEAGLEDYLFKI